MFVKVFRQGLSLIKASFSFVTIKKKKRNQFTGCRLLQDTFVVCYAHWRMSRSIWNSIGIAFKFEIPPFNFRQRSRLAECLLFLFSSFLLVALEAHLVRTVTFIAVAICRATGRQVERLKFLIPYETRGRARGNSGSFVLGQLCSSSRVRRRDIKAKGKRRDRLRALQVKCR